MWPITLSGRLRIEALVSRYLTNKLMRRGSILQRNKFLWLKDHVISEYYAVLIFLSEGYSPL